MHTGSESDSKSWKAANKGIGAAEKSGSSVLNIADAAIESGTVGDIGPAKVTFIAGWHEWTETSLSESELRNAISIVARLEFEGGSILFTGDTIGRRLDDQNEACKDAAGAIGGLRRVERKRRTISIRLPSPDAPTSAWAESSKVRPVSTCDLRRKEFGRYPDPNQSRGLQNAACTAIFVKAGPPRMVVLMFPRHACK